MRPIRRCRARAAASTCYASAVMQDEVAAARKAAESRTARRGAPGLTSARSRRRRRARFSTASWPPSSGRTDDLDAALEHAQKAASLDPTEPRALVLIGEILEAQRRLDAGRRGVRGRARARAERRARRPSVEAPARAGGARRDARRSTARSRRAATITRGAARGAASASGSSRCCRALDRRTPVVITDTRGNWAAPWILAVARAGVMEVYPEPHVPAAADRPARRPRAGGQPRPGADRRRRSRRSAPRGASDAAPHFRRRRRRT